MKRKIAVPWNSSLAHPLEYWLEGVILRIDTDKILVSIYWSITDHRWFAKTSEQIAPFGTYTTTPPLSGYKYLAPPHRPNLVECLSDKQNMRNKSIRPVEHHGSAEPTVESTLSDEDEPEPLHMCITVEYDENIHIALHHCLPDFFQRACQENSLTVQNLSLQQTNDILHQWFSSDVILLICAYTYCNGDLMMRHRDSGGIRVYSQTLKQQTRQIDDYLHYKVYEAYCLSGDRGRMLWQKCKAYSFLKQNAMLATDVATVHFWSDEDPYQFALIEDRIKDVHDYSLYRAEGNGQHAKLNEYSFMDEFVYRALDSPSDCLNLCRLAHCKHSMSNIKMPDLSGLERFVMFVHDEPTIKTFDQCTRSLMKYLNDFDLAFCVFQFVS